MHVLKKVLISVVIGLGLASIAAAAVPGPHRALCPSCFGMAEIAPDIWTDADPQRATRILSLYQEGRQTVSAFFGEPRSAPRVLLCQKDACTSMFGVVGPRGMAWGYTLVRINPLGLNRSIIAHELLHTELHHRMGQLGMWNNVIPRWFNEGLAIHISGDQRFPGPWSDSERQTVLEIVSLHDWKRALNEDTWRMLYGASASIVADIEARHGRDALVEIIDRVTVGGEDFEAVVAQFL